MPEAGQRSYNICAELLPNEQWAIEHMDRLTVTHALTKSLRNETESYKVVIQDYEREPLTVDSSSLRSGQVGAWPTTGDVEYYVCVRPDDFGWNALATTVTVKQENASDPFYGYRTCSRFVASHSEFCGCFFTVGEFDAADDEPRFAGQRRSGWITVDQTYSIAQLAQVDAKSRYRSGCCAGLPHGSAVFGVSTPLDSFASSSGASLVRAWGTCSGSDLANPSARS
ncbi:hypothetical protein DIPPA_06397 [Diplonema papillatum]|nr:hypothetical protein DIPPA_06397 [Diplonema papillatum]